MADGASVFSRNNKVLTIRVTENPRMTDNLPVQHLSRLKAKVQIPQATVKQASAGGPSAREQVEMTEGGLAPPHLRSGMSRVAVWLLSLTNKYLSVSCLMMVDKGRILRETPFYG